MGRAAEEKKSFPVVWQRCKTASSPELRRALVMMLAARPNREVTAEIDRELCSRFESSADPDTALLLGMCASDGSLQLLAGRERADSCELRNAVRLALARRGNSEAETAFVEEFLRQAVGRGEPVNWAMDQKSRECVRNLEYIGSPKCLLAFCEATVSIQAQEMGKAPFTAGSALPMVAIMMDFLGRIGLPMPAHSNRLELMDWWTSNRAIMCARLNDKAEELPRLEPMRIVVPRE